MAGIDRRSEAGMPFPVGGMLPRELPTLYRRFYTSVLKGQLYLPRGREVAPLALKHSLHEALVPLTPEMRVELTDGLHMHLDATFSNPMWYKFAGPVFLIRSRDEDPQGEDEPFREASGLYSNMHGFLVGERAQEFKRAGKTPLSPQEKEKRLTSPDFCMYAHYNLNRGITPFFPHAAGHLVREQSGELVADSYEYSTEGFQMMVDLVRTNQGKSSTDELHGLDIGGSNGLAAHEAEQLDPHLAMTILSLSFEPALWDLRGGHIFFQAESLPLALSEKYDLIISNNTIPFTPYPDLAIENALRALSPGGILSIDIARPGSHSKKREQYEMAVERQLVRMEDLHRRGIITYLEDPDLLDIWRTRSRNREVYMLLQKNTSIPNTKQQQ
jgi:SAM-dependent methyltransferase